MVKSVLRLLMDCLRLCSLYGTSLQVERGFIALGLLYQAGSENGILSLMAGGIMTFNTRIFLNNGRAKATTIRMEKRNDTLRTDKEKHG